MNFNQSPYFDDFDEQNKFYRILFRPGVAVQTREVNQLQSILQNQITKFGDHVFKNGSMVIPGQVNYNDKLRYLTLASTNLGAETLDYLQDKTLTQNVNGTGVSALVIAAVAATETDPITLVLLYTQSNQTVTGEDDQQEFAANSTVYVREDPTKTLTVAPAPDFSGRSVAAGLQAGVYYINGYFVNVGGQVVVVKKYADDITDINAKIGLQYTETIVTSDTDTSLFDNAAGTPNAAAPGAHRYKIDAEFVQVGLDDTPENFFELIRVQDGVLQNLVNASQYNILEETLARRTFDESGNYVVDDFKFELRESRLNNRGLWAANATYLVGDYVESTDGRYFECLQAGVSGGTQPTLFTDASTDETVVVADGVGTLRWRYTTNILSNRGLSLTGSSSDLVAVYGLGKAYVQGFEINKLTNSNIIIPKARTTRSINNATIYTPVGNYIWLDRRYMSGVPDISTGPEVKLFDRVTANRTINKFGWGQQVGTARAVWSEPDARGGLRLGLSDIEMVPGRSFDRDANSVVVFDSTTASTVTSFTLNGSVKYAGNTTSGFLQIAGPAITGTTSAAIMNVTGLLTAYLNEVLPGDVICFGSSSNAVTSSWTVVSVVNNTTITVTGPPIATSAGTSIFVRFATQTVFGHATGNTTRFQSEFRTGDTVWLGTASGSTTGTVLSVINENRMLVSSNLTQLIAGTSVGIYYSGRTASFAADVWENYQLGINARKLTGLFQVQDYTGGTTVVPAHMALRIQGSTDAKLLSEVAVNDLLDINSNRIFVTKVSSNSQAYGVCLDGPITGSNTQYSAFKTTNSVVDAANNTLLFPVAPATVSSITDNIYTVYKSQQISGLTGLSSITVTLAAASGSAAAEQLATTDVNAFFVAQDNASTLSSPFTVTNVSVVGLNVTLSISGTFTASTARVIFPVVRSSASANQLGRVRTKTLNLGASDEILATSTATQREITLSRTDVFRIAKILQATDFVAAWTAGVEATATDVTTRYILDTGQRNTFYDLGRIILRPGVTPATGSLKVYYDWFSHGAGDFFALDSYANVLPPELIPEYNNVSLGDVLDFRSSVNSSTGLVTGSAPPRFGTNYIADISYYLGRKEKIFLDRTGVFYNVAGASDINPVEPLATANNNSIHLNTLTLSPYTARAEYPDVTVRSIDNRRYTMKDIGQIERRVVNLEEASTLSLLEAKTSALQIRDNLDSTLERYKTGFFVDNFSDASNADHNNDGRFSLDDRNRTIQPFVEYFSLPLVERINYTVAATTAAEFTPVRQARETENYTITGDLLTLNFTTSVLMQQILATTSISVAPFLTATFIGRMRIVPDQDIYENITTVNQVVGSDSSVTNTVADAVAAYRATGNWRPYRIALADATRFVGSERSAAFIPFCRANTIMMVAKGLKANTKHYAFFDDINIGRYITGAIKLTFDSMDILDFEGSRAAVKNEVPRRRSVAESLDIREVVRAIRFRRRGRNRWRYEYGWFRRTWTPRTKDLSLPSPATRDSYRQALGFGPSVWYYEGSGGNRRLVGTAVAAHQLGTTLYLINGRGKLSAAWLRSQTNQAYNYTGEFYVSVESDVKRFNSSVAVTVGSACTSNESGELFSDSQGTVVALFDLPDTDEDKFLSGRRPVVITDHPTNHPDDWTSRSEATYLCEGYNVTITNNFVSTKVFVARPYDPIAQSFKLPTQYENGAFITDVDIYFQAKPVAEQAPVMLEVRTCDSTGRPSATEILPGSEVIKYPADVNVDATLGQVATKFTFRQPLYLLPEKNYALVLKSDTKNYRVWIATLGQPDVATPTSSYSTQATLGSLFKSQDGTLWTEDQLSDMKFRINRAVFNTADVGARVHVVNQNLTNAQLPSNPFTFVHGSNKIRVSHRNHGLSVGDVTRLFSEYWHGQRRLNDAATISGIPVGEIFGSFITSTLTSYQPDPNDPVLPVSDVSIDTYTITTTTPANLGATAVTGVTSLTSGGDDIVGQNNILYHVVKPRATVLMSKPTTLTMQGKMLRGFTYDNDEDTPPVPYTWVTQTLNINADNILNSSHIVCTDLNEFVRVDSSVAITAGGASANWLDSFIGILNLTTTTDHVSPAVDMSTLNLDLVQHRIDNPSYSNRYPNPLPAIGSTSQLLLISTIASGNTTISFNGAAEIISTTTPGLFSLVTPGKYLVVSGSTTVGNTYTSTGILVLSVNPEGTQITVSGQLTTAAAGPAISIWQLEDFIEETTDGSASGESKYITKQVDLRNPATQLKMVLEVNCPSSADFDVYYRTGSAGADLSNTIWQRFVAPLQNNPTSSYAALNKTETRGVFTDVEFNLSNFTSTGTPIDLAPFTAFQIKLVMRSSNAARFPQFRNLRVIAHA